MESHSLIFGSCIASSSVPSNQIPIKSLFNPRMSTTSFLSNFQSLSLKTCSCYPSDLVITKKNLMVRNSIQNSQSNVVAYTGNDLIANIRKKNLAVFVSGGGSNFRSLHEATVSGSVHGDIVVLVTNKPGIISFYPSLYLIPFLIYINIYFKSLVQHIRVPFLALHFWLFASNLSCLILNLFPILILKWKMMY